MATIRLMLVGLVIAFSLAACRTTQTVEEPVDDDWIADRVRTELTSPTFPDLRNVDVDVTDGVVTVSGEAPSQRVRSKAEAKIWNITGVTGVKNEIRLEEEAATPPT